MIQGFNKVSTKILPRLIAAVSGLEKQGKTSFALSAPGPIIYFNFDYGLEGVANHYAHGKDIYVKEYKFSRNDTADKYITLWSAFNNDFHSALKSNARTVVVDTATEAWELLRLARFGKLSQVMPHHYGPVNAEYTTLIRAGYSYDKNVILLHKLKKQYVNDQFSGKYERAGFTNTGFLVQTNLEVYRDGLDGQFFVKVIDCRQNSMLGGMEFEISDRSGGFGFLAQLVFPESSEGDWV
jgi:hypothetical protein